MASSQQMVSAYLESVIEQLTGVDKAVPDHEGDYAVEVGGARYWARVDGSDPAIVRVYSTVLVGLEPTPELYEALFKAVFAKFSARSERGRSYVSVPSSVALHLRKSVPGRRYYGVLWQGGEVNKHPASTLHLLGSWLVASCLVAAGFLEEACVPSNGPYMCPLHRAVTCHTCAP